MINMRYVEVRWVRLNEMGLSCVYFWILDGYVIKDYKNKIKGEPAEVSHL